MSLHEYGGPEGFEVFADMIDIIGFQAAGSWVGVAIHFHEGGGPTREFLTSPETTRELLDFWLKHGQGY